MIGRYPTAFFDLIMETISQAGNSEPVDVFVQQEFGRANLSLGFGETTATSWPRSHKSIEMGGFSCEWRIIINNRIYLASNDSLTESGFNARLHLIKFGAIRSIAMLSELDVRVAFENKVVVDFLCCTSDDEVFHCFLPNNQVVALDPKKGWTIERA